MILGDLDEQVHRRDRTERGPQGLIARQHSLGRCLGYGRVEMHRDAEPALHPAGHAPVGIEPPQPPLLTRQLTNRRRLQTGSPPHHTGDRARFLPDGNIDFLGRSDDQVKLRGVRIELGKVEAALAQHPSVREAAALVREDLPGDQRLVAYVLARNREVSEATLRTFLRERLLEQMVPSAFVMLDAMPLNPNGKVDRSALPAPDRARSELESVYVAPRTPVEQELADMWAEILDLEHVGAHDNFFDLGAHSLKATQVVSRARDRFGVELPLREVFEHPSIADLSRS